MLRIGITGNIGSGKTTVCNLFEILGVPVIYADKVSRTLLDEDEIVKEAVKELLGPESYLSSGQPDRAFIASRVFSDKEALRALNNVIHPRVHQVVRDWFDQLPPDTPYALEEAALLVESGGFRLLDMLILVIAPEELRIDRVIYRDASKREQVEARIRNQMKEDEKRKFCDYVIVNDGTQLLLPQVHKIHMELLD
ncbi:MAG: dephospho-CoA kinase [Saprospiraceae bacterium]|nr:dephospho-CoA kinase [Saprospiraceae bacterium]